MGRLADARVPAPLASAVVRLYSRAYKVDLDEAVRPDAGFANFDAFFTRALREGQRPLPADPDVIVSPADGRIDSFGPVVVNGHFSVKGRPYRAEHLVGDAEEARRYDGGQFCVVYLSPRDYHRVHAPIGGTVGVIRSYAGEYFPVNSIGERHVESLFAINRRVVVPIQTEHFGLVTVVLVGAMVVGRITTPFVAGHDVPVGDHLMTPPRVIARGDEIGIFHLGSTAVCFFEPSVGPLLCTPGPVRFGSPLAHRAPSAPEGAPRAAEPA